MSEKKSKDCDSPADWLEVTGEERETALRRAADRLLEIYRLSPRIKGKAINLHKLAYLAKARITLVKNLPGKGRILPVAGGFQVLVDADLSPRLSRAVIAHELAHSLFYVQGEGEAPVRPFASSQKEQHFCIDLVRHILAPEWLLEEAGIFEAKDLSAMFKIVTERLGMARHSAARLILADYELRVGVADRWEMDSLGWKTSKGYSSVSPSIKGNRKHQKAVRDSFRHSALGVIRGESADPETEVLCLREENRDVAFVVAVRRAPWNYGPAEA